MDLTNFWFPSGTTQSGGGSGGDPGDPVGQSLRCRATGVTGQSPHLTRSFSSASSKTGTLSFWYKRAGGYRYCSVIYSGSYQLFFNNGGSHFDVFYGTYDLGGTTGRKFRDPAAWMHIVVQCNGSNPARIWINGEEQTITNSAASVSLASGTYNISSYSNPGASTWSADGYLADWHLIDGQALDPTTFGRYNTAGVWVPVNPKKDGDTAWYGTNGFHLTFADPSDVGKDYSGNDNDFTAIAFDTTSYASGQFVHDDLAYDTGTNTVPTGGAEAPYIIDIVDPQNTGNWATYNATGAFNGKVSGDGNSDGTYLYGSNEGFTCQEFTFDLRDFPTVTNCAIWAGWNQGSGVTTSAKVYLLDSSKNEIAGTSVTPVRVGNFSERLEMCSADVGASYIKFDLSAANSYFFLWGIEVNGQLLSQEATFAPTYDIMQDSPTQNYATYNSVDPNTLSTLLYANLLQVNSTNSSYNTTATQAIPPDKFAYFEITYRASFPGVVNAGGNAWGMLFGIGPTNGAAGETPGAGYPPTNYIYYYTDAVFGFGLNSSMYNNYGEVDPSIGYGDGTMFPTGSSTGDVYGVEVDRPNNRIRIKRNGVTWAPTASTVDGDGWLTLNTSNTDDWYVQNKNVFAEADSPTINFGQQPFAFEPTGDHTTLSTGDSAVPAIQNGRDHFQALTGPGASILTDAQAAFPSGLWWIKDRVNTNQHQLVDVMNGTSDVWQSPAGTGGHTYAAPSGDSVAWCWKAGDSDAANLDGTVATTVRANPDAGFSIVQWNGPVSGTGGHGLTQSPNFVIYLGYTGGLIGAWHSAPSPAAGYFYLSSSGPWSTNIDILNSAGMTDTTVGIGSFSNGATNTAYVWHSVPGYSAFGSYKGNNSTDGPFVYTGFKPAFVLIKSTSTANWMIFDSTRGPFNPNNAVLYPNQTTAEYSGTGFPVDFLSNGFKVRVNDASLNQNNLIYAAFAENPFQAPVTAR